MWCQWWPNRKKHLTFVQVAFLFLLPFLFLKITKGFFFFFFLFLLYLHLKLYQKKVFTLSFFNSTTSRLISSKNEHLISILSIGTIVTPSLSRSLAMIFSFFFFFCFFSFSFLFQFLKMKIKEKNQLNPVRVCQTNLLTRIQFAIQSLALSLSLFTFVLLPFDRLTAQNWSSRVQP